VAGLPEEDKILQAGKQAGEAGHYHGVQGRRQPERGLACRGGGAQAGELVGHEGLMG